jgi:hypothetical protein
VAGASADDSPDEEVISIVTYLWRGPRSFLPSYVNTLARMVRHYLPEPHRFICVTDHVAGFAPEVEVLPMPEGATAVADIRTPEKEHFPSSYRRLWTFSKEAKQLGERVLLLDIDCIVVSDMRPLFRIDADFVGWSVRPPPDCPPRFGGGTWMLRTGTRTSVWERFIADPEGCIANARNAGYRGSDQAWISYSLKGEPTWPEPSGIYCSQDYLKATRSPKWVPAYSKLGRRIRGKYRKVYPEAKVPTGAIVLHMNGSDSSKPWSSTDAVTKQHWRPFFE